MNSEIKERFNAAYEVIRPAGEKVRSYYHDRSQLLSQKKGLQDYVTQADREVETLILEALRQSFPGDAFLAEETASSLDFNTADSFWSIDPIDGTANFLRGIPFFCISMAYFSKNKIQFGILLDPIANEIFSAKRGEPALLNNQPIQVSSTNHLSEATIGTGSSFRAGKPGLEMDLKILDVLQSQGVEIRKLGSAALSLAYVACGRLDGFYEYHLNAWDALASLCVIQSAGGNFSGFEGPDQMKNGSPVLASNSSLFKKLDQSLT